MVNSYLLDTSTIINLFRGKKAEQKLLESLEGERTSSFVCMAELYEGVERSKNKEEEENNLVKFFSRLDNVFTVDNDTAKKFGEIRSTLKKTGNVIEDMDILIAATCIAYDQILITNNQKHFSRIPDLKIHTNSAT